jgi:hypothetical protein
MPRCWHGDTAPGAVPSGRVATAWDAAVPQRSRHRCSVLAGDCFHDLSAPARATASATICDDDADDGRRCGPHRPCVRA